VKRKQFLRDCACGLCSCTALGALVPAMSVAAEDKKPEDWRLPFIKKRYAKLLDILGGKTSDADLSEILRQLGAYCASLSSMRPLIEKHRGDVEGYASELEKANVDINYDREKGVITVTGPESNECFCPFVDKKLTSVKACDCSLGNQEHAYRTLLGKPVRAEVKESVLRGGKRCAFQIRALE
jgi:predicted hydrocarbon binding protein